MHCYVMYGHHFTALRQMYCCVMYWYVMYSLAVLFIRNSEGCFPTSWIIYIYLYSSLIY